MRLRPSPSRPRRALPRPRNQPSYNQNHSLGTTSTYILKGGFHGCRTPQTILNFPQKDCLRTRKVSRLHFYDLRTFVGKFCRRDLRTFSAEFWRRNPQTESLLECMHQQPTRVDSPKDGGAGSTLSHPIEQRKCWGATTPQEYEPRSLLVNEDNVGEPRRR